MKTRILKALFIILLLAAIPIAAGAVTIESVAVTVTEPTAGQVPPFTATYGEGYGAYTGSVLGNGYVGVIRWTDRTENAVLNQSSVFQAGHEYKVEIALQAKKSPTTYVFSSSVTATVNGRNAYIRDLVGQGNRADYLKLEAYFFIGSISEVTVTGFSNPYSGETAVFDPSVAPGSHCHIRSSDEYLWAGTEYRQFHYGVCWRDQNTGKCLEPGDTFVGGHDYRLFVQLEADEGYYFVNDGEDPTVSGIFPNFNGFSHSAIVTAHVYEIGEHGTWRRSDCAKYAGLTTVIPVHCRIKYETNGGTELPDAFVSLNSIAVMPETDPVKEGLHFGGWYYDEAFTDPYQSSRPVKADTTFYAKWIARITVYTTDQTTGTVLEGGWITVNGGEKARIREYKPYTEGDSIVLTASPDTGYLFTGWQNANTEEFLSTDQEYSFPANQDMALIAVFEREMCTATFDSNGGSPVESQVLWCHHEKIAEPEPPTKEGCSFAGWYTSKDSTAPYDFDFWTVGDNITLYAKWNVQVDIRTCNRITGTEYEGGNFRANGGEEKVHLSETYPEGTGIALEAVSADTFRFVGWRLSGSTEYLSASPTFVLTADKNGNYFADFEKIPIDTAAVSFDEIEAYTYAAGMYLTTPDTSYSAVLVEITIDGKKQDDMMLLPRKTYALRIAFTASSTPFDSAATVTVNGKAVTMEHMSADRMSFEAVYTFTMPPSETIYTVSFDPGKGKGMMSPVKVHKYDALTAPACGFTPPEDMEFDCWLIYGTKLKTGDEYTPDGDCVWTAQWKYLPLEQIGITFSEAAGDPLLEASPQRNGARQYYRFVVQSISGPDGSGNTHLKEGAEYTVKLSFETYTGYMFDAGVKLVINGNAVPIKAINADRTYCEAEYTFTAGEKTQWTVTFEANGGEGYMDMLSIPKDSFFFLPEAAFTRDGLIPDCWTIINAGTGEILGTSRPGDAYLPKCNTTLRVEWADMPRTPIAEISADVIMPKAGEFPKNAPEAGRSGDAEKYSVRTVYQDLKFTSYEMKTTDRFEADGEYLVIVEFTAADGYAFADDVKAAFNGTDAELHEKKSSLSVCFRQKVSLARVPGDADGNGRADIQDALLILRYLRDASVPINLNNADVNGDKKVDLEDARLILQYDAGWNVTLK